MQNKRQKSKSFVNIIIVTLLVLIGGGYFFVVNNITAKGFKVRELEKQVQALKEQNEKIKLKVAEAQSITNIKDKITATNMVPVEKFNYLEAGSSEMAKR
jgi:cell division protein FtsL